MEGWNYQERLNDIIKQLKKLEDCVLISFVFVVEDNNVKEGK